MRKVCALRAFVLREGAGTRIVAPGESVLLPEPLASELIGAGKAQPAQECEDHETGLPFEPGRRRKEKRKGAQDAQQ
jgi:hypothetical protein